MTFEVEHLSICLLAVWTASVVKLPVKSLYHFPIGLPVFFLMILEEFSMYSGHETVTGYMNYISSLTLWFCFY